MNIPLKSNTGVEKPLFSENKQLKNEKTDGFLDIITCQHKEYKKIYEQAQPLNISERKKHLKETSINL